MHAENLSVYGARKVWLPLNREHIPVARCTVARLMRELGLAGVRRGKRIRTTIHRRPRPGPVTWCDAGSARSPDRLWVADFACELPGPGWSTSRSDPVTSSGRAPRT